MGQFDEQLSIWVRNATDEEAGELRELARDEELLNDAFYRELSFGTAGLRGIIGLGPNRMNVHTIGKATQGLADYLNKNFDSPSVAIARDSRNKGEQFVRAAAEVLAANGITAYVYQDVQPTPVLSFTVRDLGTSAGINVTASHNPAEYNGYKVYGPDGCQIASQAAVEIQEAIDEIDFFSDVRRVDFDEAVESGAIKWIDDAVVEHFLEQVASQSLPSTDAEGDAKLKVVYTPLNGTGLNCITRILADTGIEDVVVVPEQAKPDGDFPTCPYPNPEDRAALKLGLELCETEKPDILLASDPDADRVGVAVLHHGRYELLSGNEIGALLLDYIAMKREQRGQDLSNKLAVTTIVSTLMPDAQARKYGFELRRVLTGFKYIGGQIALLESKGRADDFMFGFEESYGYMVGTFVRDKDAVGASMLICQMAQMYKNRGMDLIEAMDELYRTYGYYLNRTINMSYPGSSGAEKISKIMNGLRTNPPIEISGIAVRKILDYEQDVTMARINGKGEPDQTLPKANVISFELLDGVKVIIRPSGTEPKIKAYIFSNGSTREESEALLERLSSAAQELLD